MFLPSRNLAAMASTRSALCKRNRHHRRRLHVEALEQRRLLAPYGATPLDTGEYLLGDVVVTVVLFESDGTIDADTENWNPALINDVKDRIQGGTEWWADTLRNLPTWWYGENPNPPEIRHSLNFQYDFTYADTPFETGYEPIARRSQDHVFPVREFLRSVGSWDDFLGIEENIRNFNHAQRDAANADWAFTIFVANDENDIDNKFAVDGQFLQAFSYPGGQYTVMPASRPASTVAHELGHQFWARDEYIGGGSYEDHRGYYDAYNSNAADNPAGGEREPSIMARGSLLDSAFALQRSSRSSLEMLGWRDSDADGIFDVLDVPLTLEGIGRFDANTNTYRFNGRTAVNTFPNLNLAGTRNDITINEVTRVEYRVDGGDWQPVQTINAPTADLDLSIPLSGSEQKLELRAIATEVGDFGNEWLIAESPWYLVADLVRPATVDRPGINGFIWRDANNDGTWDRGEATLANWTVGLVDTNGDPLDLQIRVEPDDLPENTDIGQSVPGVRLTAIGTGVDNSSVRVAAFGSASTGTKTFVHQRVGKIYSADWSSYSRRLKIEFDSPVTQVSLDAVAGVSQGIGRLDAYNAQGEVLVRYTSQELSPGEWETMTVSRAEGDIAYVIAGAHGDTFVRLDRLVVGPDATVSTDVNGAYSLPYLPPGTYQVAATAPANWEWTAPLSGTQAVTLAVGDVARHVDFGARSTAGLRPWQNPENAYDVSGDDGFVSPRDALLVIEDLNNNGARELPPPTPDYLPPPYFDVNGDGLATPIDVLLVLSFLSGNGASGEAPGSSNSGGGTPPEGELNRDLFAPLGPQQGVSNQPSTEILVGSFNLAPLQSLAGQLSPFASRGGDLTASLTFDRPARRYQVSPIFPPGQSSSDRQLDPLDDSPSTPLSARRSLQERTLRHSVNDPPAGEERREPVASDTGRRTDERDSMSPHWLDWEQWRDPSTLPLWHDLLELLARDQSEREVDDTEQAMDAGSEAAPELVPEDEPPASPPSAKTR